MSPAISPAALSLGLLRGGRFNLIGFRNRLLVLINRAWDYLLYEPAVRLILPLEAVPAPERDEGEDDRHLI